MLILKGCLANSSFAQIFLFNNGAQVYTAPTAIIQVNGGFQNDNSLSTLNVFENNGTMTISNISGIPGSVFLTNSSTLQGNGNYLVEQDWTNDALFTAANSTVNFTGNLQEFITSTNATVTTFNNLILSGTGTGINRKKTLQLVNANIGFTGTLNINDRELETLTNTMFVLNPSATCVTNNTTPGSEGFVSSSFVSGPGGSGFLSRTTNSATAYLYPTGSSTGTVRYRPINLIPASPAANTYTARLGNNDATTDGFSIALLDTTMCSLNPFYYHQIKRSSGNDNASIDMFFNLSADGGWDGIAKWNSTIPNLWNSMGSVNVTTGTPFNDILKVNWADFSNSPYILSRQRTAMPILTCSSVCSNSSGNIFSTTGTGTIYAWTSPVGTTITSGQNTNSVIIDWGTTSGPVSLTISSILGCLSSAASCTVNPMALPVAAFSSESTDQLNYKFNDLSTSGTTQWNWDFGDGSVSNSQNPSHTFSNCGSKRICLIASKNSCIDTACSDINVNQLFNIPNVFSPDGDGINDLFVIDNSCLKEYHLEIFNRWGMKVFETFLPGRGWDGYTASGVSSPAGTYYYILKTISLTGKDDSTNGFITLLRM